MSDQERQQYLTYLNTLQHEQSTASAEAMKAERTLSQLRQNSIVISRKEELIERRLAANSAFGTKLPPLPKATI